ncbi:MAG: fluoride efflux transporter CrcB [Chloroflexota bacterium]|nr:MAG: fluoride efflux transporter CrcB [Chloroflexota bacterium]
MGSTILLISLGAIAGANARYFVGIAAISALGSAFPFGTVVVNVVGSFIVGIVLTAIAGSPPHASEWRALVAVGFCGSFTTFSAFSFETLSMARQGQWFASLSYVAISLTACLGATLIGATIGRTVMQS